MRYLTPAEILKGPDLSKVKVDLSQLPYAGPKGQFPDLSAEIPQQNATAFQPSKDNKAFMDAVFPKICQHNVAKRFQGNEALRLKYINGLYQLHELTKTNIDLPEGLNHYIKYCQYLPFFIICNIHNFIESSTYAKQVLCHLAKGKSLKTISNFPVEFTKKMAHHFTNAPISCTNLKEAILYAQLSSFGGDQELYYAMQKNIPNSFLDKNKFWLKAIEFYVRESKQISYIPFEPSQIFNYFLHCHDEKKLDRFRKRKLKNFFPVIEDYYGNSNSTIKNNFKLIPEIYWKGADYQEMIYKIDDNKFYQIKQLKNNIELDMESQDMKHCVYQYWKKCLNNEISIWSCRLVTPNKIKSIATIEVSDKNEIIQLSGRYNSGISKKIGKMVKSWAIKEQLSIDKDINI